MFNINTTLLYYIPILNIILNLILILSQITIVYIIKPINSLLYLIVILTLFGIQLLLFNFEFYFVLLIIVYLGGIAILFLSAVMTLTILKEKKNSIFNKNLVTTKFLENLYFNIKETNGSVFSLINLQNNNLNNLIFFLIMIALLKIDCTFL